FYAHRYGTQAVLLFPVWLIPFAVTNYPCSASHRCFSKTVIPVPIEIQLMVPRLQLPVIKLSFSPMTPTKMQSMLSPAFLGNRHLLLWFRLARCDLSRLPASSAAPVAQALWYFFASMTFGILHRFL